MAGVARTTIRHGVTINGLLPGPFDTDRLRGTTKARAAKDGKSTEEILTEMARAQVRCPLLDDDGLCEMYDARPVTCRIYGVPTAIGGEAHTCGKSAFEKGQAYPTVYLDRIQDRLYALSHELAGSLNTQYKELGEVLVPVSLALLTEYTEEYLGIKKPGDASAAATTAGKAPAAPAEASPETPAPGAGARPRTPAQAPRGKALGGKVSAGATTAGKGLAECAGCSPEAKQGGCAGCAPKSFTIGQAPEKPVKKPAAKAVAKPAAKAPEKTPAKKSAKPTGKG